MFLVFLCSFILAAHGESASIEHATSGSLLVLSTVKSVEADLGDLFDLRRSQGWQVTIGHVESSSPSLCAAIVAKEQKRNPNLSHVLLVGSDVSLPMKRQPNYRIQRNEANLPILTDDIYGLLDTSGVPRLAIGRLPADEPAILQRLATKIIRYERNLKNLAPEVFLFCGRQPADPKPLLGGISQQTAVDGMSKILLEDMRSRLPRLKVRLRTAFPGPDYYEFANAPAVFCEGLAARPMMAVYVGHADRNGFATCHDSEHVFSVKRNDVRAFHITQVCGPLITGGCSMLDPKGNGAPIGHELLWLSGGPVAVAGFTGVNDDFWVAQFFEVCADELSKARQTTLGDLVRVIKRRLAHEPQSPRSVLFQTFMQMAGEIRSDLPQIDYPSVVRKNNALLNLIGDPTTTIVIP
jgi:hypothetical protein